MDNALLRAPRTDSLGSVTLSDMKWAPSGLCGTQAHVGRSQSWNGLPQPDIYFFSFFLFLVRQSGPLPKHTDPNPMNFQCLVGQPWAPMKLGPLPEEILPTPLIHLNRFIHPHLAQTAQ